MINIDDYVILKNNLSTLKETSKDNHDGTVTYMTESDLKVINFDAVKDDYVRNMHISEVPKSNDALFIGTDDIVFIEFKNGEINNKNKFGVRLKIFDSILIFLDVVGVTPSFTRANMNYILVYNESENPTPLITKDTVQDSPSRTRISKHYIEEKAKKKFIRFDLERFEKLYFKEVYTYTQDEFRKNFEQKYESIGTGV